MVFYPLIGDLVGSRNVADRRALAAQVREALSAGNARAGETWHAPLVLTKGIDELSGVLRHPGAAFDVAVTVNEAVWPLSFRFALASGRVDVAADSGNAAAMDGEAFHRAAAALDRARKDRLPFAIDLKAVAPSVTGMLEQLALLRALRVSEWTEVQANVAKEYRRLESQAAVASDLNVTQQTVSEHLSRAHWREIVAAEDAIRVFLAALPEVNHG